MGLCTQKRIPHSFWYPFFSFIIIIWTQKNFTLVFLFTDFLFFQKIKNKKQSPPASEKKDRHLSVMTVSFYAERVPHIFMVQNNRHLLRLLF